MRFLHLPKLVLALILVPPSLQAAEPEMVALGRAIATGDVLPEEQRCQRCHGASGRGRADENAPRIAGQPIFYLEKQLADFAAGTRKSEHMEPIAKRLTPPQRAAAAAYFGSLPPPPYDATGEADPALLQLGGVLSSVGDEERGIRACELCHGDAGVGIPPSFPYLAGIDQDYTERQILSWKDGTRTNDPLEVMAEISRRLSDQEVRALALYFARVRPPAPTVSSPIPAEPIPPPPEPVAPPD